MESPIPTQSEREARGYVEKIGWKSLGANQESGMDWNGGHLGGIAGLP